jgi:hypothetical protein
MAWVGAVAERVASLEPVIADHAPIRRLLPDTREGKLHAATSVGTRRPRAERELQRGITGRRAVTEELVNRSGWRSTGGELDAARGDPVRASGRTREHPE